MHNRTIRFGVAALAAGLLAVPGTAVAVPSASQPAQPRLHQLASHRGTTSRPAVRLATGSLWLYHEEFFSGQIQEVQDPGTSACVNLPEAFDTWSQQSESAFNVEVYSQAGCEGSPDYTFSPNESEFFQPLTVASARFLHE